MIRTRLAAFFAVALAVVAIGVGVRLTYDRWGYEPTSVTRLTYEDGTAIHWVQLLKKWDFLPGEDQTSSTVSTHRYARLLEAAGRSSPAHTQRRFEDEQWVLVDFTPLVDGVDAVGPAEG